MFSFPGFPDVASKSVLVPIKRWERVGDLISINESSLCKYVVLLSFLVLVFLKCMEHIKTTLLFLKNYKSNIYVYIYYKSNIYVCTYSMHKTCDSIETHKEKFTYHCVQRKPSLTCWCISCSLSSVKTETHYHFIDWFLLNNVFPSVNK